MTAVEATVMGGTVTPEGTATDVYSAAVLIMTDCPCDWLSVVVVVVTTDDAWAADSDVFCETL